MLRRGVPLLGGASIPVHRRRTVLRDPGAGDIQAPEIELRRRVALLGAGAQLVDVALGEDGCGGYKQDAGRQKSPGRADRAAHRHRPVAIGAAPVTPAPSVTVIVCPASTAPSVSTWPLGQSTRTALAVVAASSPNVRGSSLCDR